MAGVLALLLTSCFPPDFVVVDPEPVLPDPVEVVEIFENEWEGFLSFVSTDGFGNEETQSVGLSTTIENHNMYVSGDLLFETALLEECSLAGEQAELVVSFIVFCDNEEGYSFSGELDEGVLRGTYEVVSFGLTIKDGVFSLSFVGSGNE